MFKINVGTWDRRVRIVAGLFIVSLVFWGPKTWWGLLGLLPITTGTIRFCPAYLPFGLSTCEKQPEAQGGMK